MIKITILKPRIKMWGIIVLKPRFQFDKKAPNSKSKIKNFVLSLIFKEF